MKLSEKEWIDLTYLNAVIEIKQMRTAGLFKCPTHSRVLSVKPHYDFDSTKIEISKQCCSGNAHRVAELLEERGVGDYVIIIDNQNR